MEESTYRQSQMATRLLGGAATITGALGSGRAPGRVEIHVGGNRLGVGRTFEQALQYASQRAAGKVTTGVAGAA